MASIRFSFNGLQSIIQCRKDEIMKDICNKYSSKIGKNINELKFLYWGNQIQFELTFNEQANWIDKKMIQWIY